MKKILTGIALLFILIIACCGCTSQKSTSSSVSSKTAISKPTVSASSASSISSVINDDNKVTVPDLVGSTQDIAKSTLPALGLIPKFDYQYTDGNLKKGDVYETSPKYGEKIAKGSSVKVIISKGSATEVPKAFEIRYWHINDYSDESYRCDAKLNKGVIEFNLYPTVSVNQGQLTDWLQLKGTGIASDDANFNTSVPCNYTFETKTLYENTPQLIAFKVPVDSFKSDHPATVCVKLDTTIGGKDSSLRLQFNFTW